MPARPRTSTDAILAAGLELLETGGVDAVTMQAIADRVGVRAPSLYKRYVNRTALLAALADAGFAEQAALFRRALRGGDAAADVTRLANAYRDFAHRRPQMYRLLFLELGDGDEDATAARRAAAQPLLDLTERLVGSERSLDAARLLTAFVHGFVSMELAGAFRLGGDVDRAYGYGVETLVAALARDV
ncbi:MAG: TetR/AcrR family transcriptional regulator [Chloroflexota bacterium]